MIECDKKDIYGIILAFLLLADVLGDIFLNGDILSSKEKIQWRTKIIIKVVDVKQKKSSRCERNLGKQHIMK